MKPVVDIPALFKPTFVTKVIVTTQAQLDAQAAAARNTTAPPRDDPEWAENPRWPWEPAAPLDAPGIDCSILDAGRTPRQEKAA